MADIVTRPLQADDLDRVAAIHCAAFSTSPLTLLGREAVRRYYAWLLGGPHDVTAVGAFSSGQCVGFSFGGVFRGAMTGFLKRNRVYLGLRVLSHPWLLARAPFRSRLWQGLRILGRRQKKPGPAPSATPSFGILSIAVDPAWQGSGAASALMRESESAAVRLGFRQMHLTVHPENARAVRFYEKSGWRRHPEGPTWSGSFRRSLGA